jgi:hypothetical protein
VGASSWHYVVDYQDDLPRVLAELQEQVLATGQYYHGLEDRLSFTTMADLEAAKDTEAFWEEGTHSILDMVDVVPPRGREGVAVVRFLRDRELRTHFGATRPERADFDRFVATDWYVNRWEGRATVLYKEGLPHQMAFWGVSGD